MPDDIGAEFDTGIAFVDTPPPADDPEPEPAPAAAQPEPEPAQPEPQPEAEAYPSWLYAEEERQAPPPQYTDAYYQNMYHQQYAPQYQQPTVPQPAPAGMSDAMLERFVRDPQGVITELVEQRLQSAVGPMAQNLAGTQQMARTSLMAQVEHRAGAAEAAIKDGYKRVFSKDAAFMGNKSVKDRAERYMKNQFASAVREAKNGNLDKFNVFMHPRFADGVLALSKVLEGFPVDQAGPISAGKATVGSATRNVRGSSEEPQLTPDMEAAVSRLGPGGRERYIKALNEANKRGDIEFS